MKLTVSQKKRSKRDISTLPVPLSVLLSSVLYVSACATTGVAKDTEVKPVLAEFTVPVLPPDPVAATDGKHVVLHNVTVMTAAGDIFASGYIEFNKGRIVSLGTGSGPKMFNGERIDGQKGYVTPGIIDTHSHMGVYPFPGAIAHSDGNEAVSPTTPAVWAEHAFWPQDPSLWRAMAGGVTTVQVLPGSANLIGGRSFTAKLTPHISARQMRFPGAPQGLKMACGENPKRVYKDKGGPRTRMGNVAGYRKAFQGALEYRRSWRSYHRDLAWWKKQEGKDDSGSGKAIDPPSPPARNFNNETLMLLLDGKIDAHIHCYRADEMSIMLDLAKSFGFTIKSFHHGLEAYKIADRLAQEKVSVSTWSDWWGFKMEAFDGIPYNAALLEKAGVITIIHSDSETELRHLNQEAAKANTSAAQLGYAFDDNTVLRWITHNPAWALGIDKQTGTLETGKMADLVLWDGHPFSVYSKTKRVFIDGKETYNREQGPYISDFEVGLALDLIKEKN